MVQRLVSGGSKDPPLQELSLHETAANYFWETNRVLERTRKARTATGLSPDMNDSPHFTIALRRSLLLRLIGRQAPVKRCLARKSTCEIPNRPDQTA
jgi:hypothetical protein